MSRCQHKQKISVFCITQGCDYKESGGCQTCIKKYHNHCGQSKTINLSSIEAILAKLVTPIDTKPKCRLYQQTIYNYLQHVKTQLNLALDGLSRNIIDQLGFPFLFSNGYLQFYQKLKSNEYKDIKQTDLIQFIDFITNCDTANIQTNENRFYYQQADKAYHTISTLHQLFSTFSPILKNYKSNILIDQQFRDKIDEVHTIIKIYNPQNVVNSYEEYYEQPNEQPQETNTKPQVKQTKQNRPRNCSVEFKLNHNEGEANNDLTSNFLGSLIGHQQLPAKVQSQKLYEQKQTINKKTFTVPLENNLNQQEPSSPLLKKHRTLIMGKQFSLGLKKITEKQNQESQTINHQINQDKHEIDISTHQINSLALLLKALPMSSNLAIPLLKASLQQANNNLSAAQYLSYLYLQNNSPKQCLDLCNVFLNKIITSENNQQLSIHLWNNKAVALNMLGRYSESIQAIQLCLAFTQKDILYKNLGDAYFFLGIIQKSLESYRKAILLNNQFDQAYYNMAVSLYHQKKYQECHIAIQKAIQICPDNQSYIQLHENNKGNIRY